MSVNQKEGGKQVVEENIDCMECSNQAACCKIGAWIDLEEAKKILPLGLKGEFFQLEEDSDFPSGYKIGTSYDENPCTFQDPDGLCSIHKIDYGLKPQTCKDFPYEDNKVSPFAEILCVIHKSRLKERNSKKV